jgi:S-adenosylmethionine:tRNA ribosyltransferase-isomerase
MSFSGVKPQGTIENDRRIQIPGMKKLLSFYDYRFPADLIAQTPASPRDSARLLVHDRKTGKTFWDTFRNIGNHLPEDALLVLNETKVYPARLELKKITGGRVKALFLESRRRANRALLDRHMDPGEVLFHKSGKRFTVLAKTGPEYILRSEFTPGVLGRLLEDSGETPIPPYIKHTPLSAIELKREYQAVFARKPGSVAAPTASLHFTKPLLTALEKEGIGICRITLHVNLGTFAPLTEEHVKTNKLHLEEFEISAASARKINEAIRKKRPIIAVGTTVVRALESAGRTGRVRAGKGQTDLFIRDKFRLRIVNGIITNFHVPRSSLLMLVSAFLSRSRLLRLYRAAIRRRFRLFSFGDAMFIK